MPADTDDDATRTEVASRAAGIMQELGIGNTPVVELSPRDRPGRVLLKQEYLNPFAGMKDRTAAYLISWAVVRFGLDVQIVECTSGNLGVALGQICGAVGIAPPIVVVDSSTPRGKLDRVELSGATIELVHAADPGSDLRQTRMRVARELGSRWNHVWVNQYANEAAVWAHFDTTGVEIVAYIRRELAGAPASVLCPISTGGSSCGIALRLQQEATGSDVRVVEPVGSTIFGGDAGDFITSGAGMSGPSEIVRRHGALLTRAMHIDDASAIAACKGFSLSGRYLGITTGMTLAALPDLMLGDGDRPAIILAPDDGAKYAEQLGVEP
jgi:cysteine synthase